MADDMKRCPWCGEEILFQAVKCKFCHELLQPNSETIKHTEITNGSLIAANTIFIVLYCIVIGLIFIIIYPFSSTIHIFSRENQQNLLIGLMIYLAFWIYFIPTDVALTRKHNNALMILVLNLFLGWTLIAWALTLAFSCSNNVQPNIEEYKFINSTHKTMAALGIIFILFALGLFCYFNIFETNITNKKSVTTNQTKKANDVPYKNNNLQEHSQTYQNNSQSSTTKIPSKDDSSSNVPTALHPVNFNHKEKAYHNESNNSQTYSETHDTNSMSSANTVDFKPYMREMQRKIRMNWRPSSTNETQKILLLFKIAKDGNLLSVKVLKSSGVASADETAINAVKLAAPFEPLPADFKGEDINIQFTFDYNAFKKTEE